MSYYLEISEAAKRQIRKLPPELEKHVLSKIYELKENPRIGKPLIRSRRHNAMLWELRFMSSGVRVYYTIHEGVIVIEDVAYSGNVRIHCLGDKKSQRRDINGLV